MAKQDANPPTWKPEMANGCTGVLDWLPFVGSMLDCCDSHDEAFYNGGGEAEFQQANQDFRDCIASSYRCWFCHKVAWLVSRWRKWGVERFGRSHFNWKGPGLPAKEG